MHKSVDCFACCICRYSAFRKTCRFLGGLPHRYENFFWNNFHHFPLLLKCFNVACMWCITIENHSSLMIGYNKKHPQKPPWEVILKIKKIWDRVDSEDQYGRWKLWVMGSWLSTTIDYRPISLLPAINNIFEKLLASQLQAHFEGIIADHLSAYHTNYSCQMALLRMVEEWKDSLSNNRLVATISMHLSKAFDSLPHSLLLTELKAYGLNHHTCHLLKDNLQDREQWVKISDTYSPWLCVKGTQSCFCACARVWFLNRRLRIQWRGNWHRAFTNPFASSSIDFGFALKLLRIKDQWYTVLVKCQFVCNRDFSVLTSIAFDGTSSGGRCYGAGRRWLSFGNFQKGLENWERTEKKWTNMAGFLKRNRFTRLGKE